MKTLLQLLDEIEARAEKQASILKEQEDFAACYQAYKNGGLYSLAYDRMCKYIGRNHEGRCENIIRECMLIADYHATRTHVRLVAVLRKVIEQRDWYQRQVSDRKLIGRHDEEELATILRGEE